MVELNKDRYLLIGRLLCSYANGDENIHCKNWCIAGNVPIERPFPAFRDAESKKC